MTLEEERIAWMRTNAGAVLAAAISRGAPCSSERLALGLADLFDECGRIGALSAEQRAPLVDKAEQGNGE